MKNEVISAESGNVLEDGATMAARKKTLSEPISMRLSPADTRLDEIAVQTSIPRLTLARLALRLGTPRHPPQSGDVVRRR